MQPAIRIQLRRLAIIFGIALLIFLFGLSSNAVEKIYSDGLYQWTSVAQRFISAIVPFALGDFLYAALIIFCLWSVYKVIKKAVRKELTSADRLVIPLQLISFLLILYIVFKLLWGLNYSRPSISERLGISDQKYSTKELVMLGGFLVDKVNLLDQERKSHKRIYDINDLRDHSKAGYDLMAKENSFFSYRAPAVKPVMFSWLISKIGIEGYYCPLSGEANVNMRLPYMELPFVTSHEISHTLGIAREDEANLIGYLVSINNTDVNFRYSGYYNILRSVLFEIRLKSPEDFSRLLKEINANTLADFKEEHEFWRKYNGDMSAYMGTALDKFLKINNQKKGTDSYQDIVLWVFNLHKKEMTETAATTQKTLQLQNK
ncbi:DUF3810 domain-containing protein [Pedobacter sp. MC2016-15]|uniref:DUF3810 domain-containing protein n=1 Tax=Pedobacter sp. MC2016-15 TaxID=2994473 RepID=UPI00224793CB|nr:DUF3810 domain-containing protein [Pedobacter sp. MC2016-15]MCX2479272.1 DUF3810 domain-containing protein [Pedobacter sp. MC2016-15]